MSVLPDQADRDAAVKDTASSILVEASAGTGKTTTLVNRVLELALADGVPLSRIAAMTFTEKAAGEMKERLREALDEASVSADALRRARAVEARRDLEAAPISTLHAFCGRLLRERPVEAGVDPDFVTPEESVTEELLDALFADWLDRVAREEGPIADALRQGLAPAELRELAGELYSDRALVLSGTLERDPLPFVRREVLRLALTGSRPARRDPRRRTRREEGAPPRRGRLRARERSPRPPTRRSPRSRPPSRSRSSAASAASGARS